MTPTDHAPAARNVRILADALINKIAAGEVVERPASVVKELVENAVDAGATTVRVELRGGGRSLVGVRDDGCGMSRDDVLLAIERHATSKIRTPEDLFDIHTLGFRGEALPAIAQVSRMEIRTAVRGESSGTLLQLDGGVLKAVRDAPPVPGTEILVRRLFFNTPVRLRFLKTERTELGHATEAVVRIALAHPGVRFELWRMGGGSDKGILQTPVTGDLALRVSDLLGRSIRSRLVEVDRQDDDLHVHGLVGDPTQHRSSRTGLHLFVNGRPVRDRLLLGAVAEGYRGLIPKGRHPIVVLFCELPVAEVDHNVHPTKSEVRFARGQQVFRFVANTVADALRQTPSPRPERMSPQPTQVEFPRSGGGVPSWSAVREAIFDDVAPEPGVTPTNTLHGERPVPRDRPADNGPGGFSSMRFLGQFEGTYLLLQDGRDLVVMDQHAAHERINYERILLDEASECQTLLVPEVIDLPRSQCEAMLARLDMLSGLGIEMSDFGGGSLAVSAVPPSVPPGEVRDLVRDVAQELVGHRPSTAVDDLKHRIAALAACHSSVRAHQRLSPEQIRALLVGLDHAEHPYSCPHGRPLVARFSLREVEKWFDRT